MGLITGAADDDCSAIGTSAQAGAQFGYKVLWTAPVTFPMMVAVVYLSGKLGMRALVIAGIVQGFPTPPLMMLIMVMTNNRSIMGDHKNGWWANIFGWVTTVTIFAATLGLIVSWLAH